MLGIALAIVALFVFLIGDDEVDTAPAGSFYDTPAGISEASPGEVLRTEAVAEEPEGASAVRVLYATHSNPGEPIVAASGTIFIPDGVEPSDERSMVLWAHPTVGIASRCAPSLDADGGASFVPGLERFLGAGHVVVAPDYPGLGTDGIHPYLVGISEGRSVLDAARAAGELPEAGAGRTLALWGHSQGGHAALFAAQLQPGYAPELDLRGTAVAAPAAELRQLLSLDLSETAGKILGSLAAVSWAGYYPQASLGQIVPAAAKPVLKGIAKRCIVSKTDYLADLPLAQTLKSFGVLTFSDLKKAPWSGLLELNTPKPRAQPAPLFVAQGTKDLIVRPQTTAAFVRRLCRLGRDVVLRAIDGGDHTFAGFDSAPEAAKWIDQRLEGSAPQSNCAKLPELGSVG